MVFLPAGEVMLVQVSGDDVTCSHLDSGDCIRLSGRFSAALSALLAGIADERDAAILGQLGRQYPCLRGLEQATCRPEAMLPLLLGRGLGLLFVELTSRCNERCIHCYAEAGPERHESLPLRVVCDVLAQSRAFGCPTVQFTGGDPLLHPDIVDAVRQAHALGYEDIEIYTNGLLLSERMLTRLAAYSPRFAFSLYAHEAAIHDGITRVPGSFSRTVAALRRAKAAGLEVRVGVTLMPENRDLERKIRHFAEDALALPASRIHMARMKAVGRGRAAPSAERTDHGNAGGWRRAQDAEGATRRQGKLCIAADGNVYPCIFARQTRLGNVYEHSLEEIMRRLDGRAPASPSTRRWRRCLQAFGCRDCRIIAYALGEERAHAA